MSPEAFHVHVDCLARALGVVWDENVRDAVAITPDVLALPADVALDIGKDCALIPAYDPARRRVVWPHALTYYTLYFQQALAFYVLDLGGTTLTPERVVDYFGTQLKSKLLDHRRGCPASDMRITGRIPDQLPSVLDGRMTQAEYEAFWRSVAGSPLLDELQAYLAFGPTLFILLHEAGHAVLHASGTV
ncbi:MAG: hypothetical protein ACK40V_11630, partial [Anaerolineales bacterium]